MNNEMAKGKIKRKNVVKQRDNNKDDSFILKTCSSMRVNLSYVSNLSNSEHDSLTKSSIENSENISDESLLYNDNLLKTKKKCQTKKLHTNDDITSHSNITNITAVDNGSSCFLANANESKKVKNKSLMNIKEKEQLLNKSCMQLKDAIMNKTKALFDKENELAIKTSEVLAAGCISPSSKILDINDKRSSSVKVNIGKNDQIIMSGDGRKQNPVQVNTMVRHHSIDTEYNMFSKRIDGDYVNCNQSIVSTPKKIRTESYINREKYCDKTSSTILKIPVTRLFNDNNYPNNSMSDINLLYGVNRRKRNIANNNEKSTSNINNIHGVSHELNSVSPILSQGIRKSKLFRLPLKKKLTKNLTQISSGLSSSVANEKFCNKKVFTCSSFIDKQVNTNNENEVDEICRTINLNKKTKADSCSSINLVNNENHSKTTDISKNSNQSCMEITAISSHVPIIHRSFQHTARKSFKFDNITTISNEEIQNVNLSRQEQSPSNIIKNLTKQFNNLESVEQIKNNTVVQNMSLNVNTSFNEIELADHIMQKENKIPKNTENKINKNGKNQIVEDDNTLIQQQNINSIPSSMQVSTSLDFIKKSLIPNSNNEELEKSVRIIHLKSNINQDKQNNHRTILREPSNSTIRSSMQVNTSLDSVQKSPVTKTTLDFNKILSTIIENSSNNNIHTLKNQSSDSDSALENVSLMERIKNISTIKRIDDKKFKKGVKSMVRKSETINLDSNNTSKSIENKDLDLTSNDVSIIEATPYPISRSVLFKTIIKNNIAMNTLDPQRFRDLNNEFQTIIHEKAVPPKKDTSAYVRKKVPSDDLSDTIVLNSSDESLIELDNEKYLVIIDESLNETKNCIKIKSDKRFNNKQTNKQVQGKRKLYPLRENSQLISFSPTEIQELSNKIESQKIKKRDRKVKQKKKQQNQLIKKNQEPINDSKPLENEILPKEAGKKKKKPRKIISKKIIVKNVRNMSIIENVMHNEEKVSQRLSDRNSLKEFDIKSMRNRRKEDCHKTCKIIIVVTGLTKEERDLVRSVIKALGSASLEANVTLRTTHVISSGIRTINLLKGIVRGCWLLSLEWALKSLENERWLDPNPYEMSHFSKAVQENRRDRQLFGKAYVPELFVTCGIIYIENGTSPPASSLKELVKVAGGRITEDPTRADIIIGSEGLREIWILDSITTGEVQSLNQYKRN